MKNLLFIFLGLGMTLIWSCDDEAAVVIEEEMPIEYCTTDYAQYNYNGTDIQTVHTPGGGEIMTQDGENCGIGAVLNTSQNILTMRIFTETQHLNIHMDIVNLNEPSNFRFLEYTDNDVVTTFQNLDLSDENFIIVEELDEVANMVKGTFTFEIESSTGELITVTDGVFNCSFGSF